MGWGNKSNAMLLAAGLLTGIGWASVAHADGSGSATLDAVLKRGQVLCGIAGDVPGFSLPDSQGVMRGLDADSCRAVDRRGAGRREQDQVRPHHDAEPLHRAAIGRSRSAVAQHHLDAGPRRQSRPGIRLGELLRRHRLPGEEAAGVKSAKETGRRHDLRAARHQHRTGDRRLLPPAQHEVHADPDPGPGRDRRAPSCPAAATPIRPTPRRWRRSGSARATKADDLVLLPDIISKEPLGVMVRKGDDKWFDIVRWTFIAMITAEEKGITSKNVDTLHGQQGPRHPPAARASRATWARRSGWTTSGPIT